MHGRAHRFKACDIARSGSIADRSGPAVGASAAHSLDTGGAGPSVTASPIGVADPRPSAIDDRI